MNPGTVRFATGVNAFPLDSEVSCGVDFSCGGDDDDDELMIL